MKNRLCIVIVFFCLQPHCIDGMDFQASKGQEREDYLAVIREGIRDGFQNGDQKRDIVDSVLYDVQLASPVSCARREKFLKAVVAGTVGRLDRKEIVGRFPSSIQSVSRAAVRGYNKKKDMQRRESRRLKWKDQNRDT